MIAVLKNPGQALRTIKGTSTQLEVPSVLRQIPIASNKYML